MILDDGGDLTNLVHTKYPQYLAGKKQSTDEWLLIIYTMGHKKRGTLLVSISLGLLTIFQNSFTITLCRQFAIM